MDRDHATWRNEFTLDGETWGLIEEYENDSRMNGAAVRIVLVLASAVIAEAVVVRPPMLGCPRLPANPETPSRGGTRTASPASSDR